MDLVLERNGQRAIIDLKWSGESYQRKKLSDGTALQLATYTELLKQNGHQVSGVAFFILSSQSVLSTSPALAGPEARITPTLEVDETWKRLVSTHKAAWRTVAGGSLTAPGTRSDAPEEQGYDEGGGLVSNPPCRWCEFDGVCGARYGKEKIDEQN